MKFPYVKYGIFYKPVLPIILKYQNNQFPYQALIDTGADISIIHSEIAEQLKIKLGEGTKHTFGGIFGGGTCYIHRLNLDIGGVIFQNVPIAFSPNISKYGFGILGHEGLFDKVRLVFEFKKKQFEITPKYYRKQWG